MSIVRIMKGDLLDFFDKGCFDLIAHGANCANLMGAGIAKSIKERYPEAYEADTATQSRGGHQRGQPNGQLAGSLSYAIVKGKGRVANLYTQVNTGSNADYFALSNCLKFLNSFCKLRDIRTVGLPLIGAGIGGLKSRAVIALVDALLPDVDVTIVAFSDKDLEELTGWQYRHAPFEYSHKPRFFRGVVFNNVDDSVTYMARKGMNKTLFRVPKSYVPNQKQLVTLGVVVDSLNNETFDVITFEKLPLNYVVVNNEEEAKKIIGKGYRCFEDLSPTRKANM